MIRQMVVAVGMGLGLWGAQPAPADEEWDKLASEYEQATEKWHEAMEKLQGESDGGPMMFNPGAMPPQPIEKFRDRFRAYAEKHTGKPEAVPALTHMLTPGMMMGGTNKSAEWALKQLKNDHADDPLLKDHLQEMRGAVMSAGEKSVIEFLETVAEKNPDRDTKGVARLRLAEVLYEGSPFAAMFGGSQTEETEAKKKRGAEILQAIKKEYAGTELAREADDFLFVIDHLQVGKKAPEIVGEDARGNPISLSQFEGKVVAIIYWATWCTPCMQMIPHERELMEKHAGKPFTILGINVDNDVSVLKQAVKKEKITWPTIYDGSPEVSKITKKWRVRSFPTIYIIDHKGVIRHTNVMPFQLESAVDGLVAEAMKDG